MFVIDVGIRFNAVLEMQVVFAHLSPGPVVFLVVSGSVVKVTVFSGVRDPSFGEYCRFCSKTVISAVYLGELSPEFSSCTAS